MQISPVIFRMNFVIDIPKVMSHVFFNQQKICSFTQGSLTIPQYFTKLNFFWDELMALASLPSCTYGASKSLSDYEQQ